YNHPLSGKVIGCAIEVHRQLGPGLLESAYQRCLAHELSLKGLAFSVEHPIPVTYKGINIDCGFRIDLWIENFLVVELKAVDHISNIHQAQLLTYMKLIEAPIGLILNFNTERLKDGIKKLVI
ncbi:MAG: GxxExxY protein, partial [Bdellovibrionales bacterium]|nr:GxxExxY protein [Bdellovibrionales bacterium]